MNHVTPELAQAAEVLIRDYVSVHDGEEIIVTADTSSDRSLVDAITNAATIAGGRVTLIVIPPLPYQGALADPWIPEPVNSAVSNCDLWLDFCFPYFAGSTSFDVAMETKRVRHLLGGDVGASGLIRLIGRVDLDLLFKLHHGLDSILANAIGHACRITTEAGTDVRFTLAKPAYKKPRHADKPGFYLMPGMVTMFPEPDSVQGHIVLEAAFHEWYAPMQEPLLLKVDGKINGVEGGGSALAAMDRALRRAGNGEYGSVIHFTCGIHPSARSTGTSFVEDARVIGSNAIGLGIPWWLPGGGENHPDGVINMQTISIDNEVIIERGVLVSPPELSLIQKDLV